MSSFYVKICGVTKPEQAQAIATLDVQAIGLIGVPHTPRYVSPEQMRSIVMSLPLQIEKVGVFCNESIAFLADCVAQIGLTTLQLHGDETPADCAELAQRCPSIRLTKAFRVRDASDLERVWDYRSVVQRILLDTYHPQHWGGTGLSLDWSLLQTFRFPLPWILAGGLKPETIEAALAVVSPSGIDVSSGVEVTPGDKDLNRIRQLLDRIAKRRATGSGDSEDAEKPALSPLQNCPSLPDLHH